MFIIRLLGRLETFMRNAVLCSIARGSELPYQRLWRASRHSIAALSILAGLGGLLSPTRALADTVYLDVISADPNPLGGGPFLAHVVTPFAGLSAGSTFETFCVEYNEEFYPGASHVYQVNIADDAVYGQSGPPNGSDALTSQTAWLYATWRAGGLAGFVNNNNPGDLYALQDAIWATQGWTSTPLDGYMATPGLATTLKTLASTSAVKGDLYGVKIMQLWDVGHVGQLGYQHQDQLILVPSPTAACGGLLLIGSMITFHYLRRRKFSVEL